MQAAINKLVGKEEYSQADVPDLHGRTAVVTGGTGGIGFEVAKTLALAKARVLLLARGSENAEEAISKIRTAAQDSSGALIDVTFIECDLGNLKHVKKVGDQIREQEERLDLLICDAGVGVNKYDTSTDGIDRHFAVNHLGHFYLVNRLLPLMRRTAAQPHTPAPRIVCVSSSLHAAAPSSVRFKSLDEINTDIGSVQLYARSKLANILFVKFGIIERVLGPASDRILALATHPGAVHTGQQEQFKEAYGNLAGTVMKHATIPFMRNPDQGSLSTLWAATCEEVEQHSPKWNGRYITDPGEGSKESDMARDAQLGENLWKLSEQLITDKVGDDALLPWNERKP
ncbi:NAD-binding protein [Laetiporus sulphureus 93-53]|uniref:NAD-binding protein n=1 Tax=Laetiporus sulphureus 93-53 TaxID=1314785 RepID=A0A165GYQ4_9APHY|nr:NAD-binding protein [Laetiporus sulphureus 93-53]KZT11007.1 NAD-binding protein [Laetiporus sulphureus 93-53]